jgi:hypothetical protein
MRMMFESSLMLLRKGFSVKHGKFNFEATSRVKTQDCWWEWDARKLKIPLHPPGTKNSFAFAEQLLFLKLTLHDLWLS